MDPHTTDAVRLMQALAGTASIVVGLEWQAIVRAGAVDGAWPAPVLRPWWGWRAALMTPPVLRSIAVVQVTLGTMLVLAAMLRDRDDPMGAIAAAGLLLTLWWTAVRVRGTLNGGSDGMLFTLLLGLTIATWPGTPPRIALGGVLFVAAQVLLSYLRAGIVKLREPAWWRGEALAAFLAIPAYGATVWFPRRGRWLRALSAITIAFELAAPVALAGPRAAVLYAVIACGFHVAVAWTLGLNRFLLVWTAALPSLWVAQAAVHR